MWLIKPVREEAGECFGQIIWIIAKSAVDGFAATYEMLALLFVFVVDDKAGFRNR